MSEHGRDEEFREFAESRADWLRKVAFLLCCDRHRADDLVQETLTKLYVQWWRMRRVENPDGYARAVLVNIFLAEQRSAWQRLVLRRSGRAGAEVQAPPTDPEGSLDLRRALAVIPARQRATLVLRYFHDLTIEQTADVLGCSAGNVKSQTSRGLQALRRVLDTRSVTAAGRTL
ncbi:RNA polymerase sigma-70 factor, sigma-E family [Streptomyces sp. DvalAA-14]|uniref:SigE family RNA polymerase sigma factor n=1 Tax=unclassified Streptomyces TaxID=2593676 RepID=UPI00081B7AFD|nr:MULTISPECIES: SigE family RNA polymerase sigma factor [unclassified Streptomyces]MYS18684.1 SigE family RNA polymerase sigma factor [Streptomyces sp. SID4948]SCD27532.1 RNA polymerase sigma-70 factor, sigma-E family [Streptomyces sp. DvalAA-14]